MSDAPRKALWKRKRWIAAAVLWLVLPIAYVLSVGPCLFLQWRGWLHWDRFGIYAPLYLAIEAAPLSVQVAADEYCQWWIRLAIQHRTGST